MNFKYKLKEHLKNVLNEEELSLLPRGFQTLGKVILLKLNPNLFEKESLIAKAYLELLPNIRSVYVNRSKIVGTFRTPEKVELIGGKDNPIVLHKENDVIYKFDITKIMFSKGNINERRYLTTLVKGGEVIVDMFAGIGYFSLPIAKHTSIKKIYSIELNPESYKYLVENIRINHLDKKIVPIKGNCRIEVKKLVNSGIRAERVIMGVFPAPKDYIREALSLVNDKGSIFHYEGVVEKDHFITLFHEFKGIALTEGYNCELKSHRTVKSYGPNLFHIVLDIFVIKI